MHQWGNLFFISRYPRFLSLYDGCMHFHLSWINRHKLRLISIVAVLASIIAVDPLSDKVITVFTSSVKFLSSVAPNTHIIALSYPFYSYLLHSSTCIQSFRFIQLLFLKCNKKKKEKRKEPPSIYTFLLEL